MADQDSTSKAKREALNAKRRDDRKNNPEKYKARDKVYRERDLAKHGDKRRAQRSAHVKANRDQINAKNRERYAENPVPILARLAAFKAKNPDKVKGYQATWRANDPDHMQAWRIATLADPVAGPILRAREQENAKVQAERRLVRLADPIEGPILRARERKLSKTNAAKRRTLEGGGIFEDFDASISWAAFQNRCAYCGVTEAALRAQGDGLTDDHIHAASKGGSYTPDNIVPSCRSCNASKSNKPLSIRKVTRLRRILARWWSGLTEK